LLQLKTYIGVSVTAVGAPTTGKLAVWASTSSLDDSLTVIEAATGFTTGSDVTIPTSACVRSEMSDIIYDESAMANPLADADTILICDGDAATAQYKATLTQLNTWINTHYSVELESLTDAEVQQLQNIGATTISAAQWGYLGGAAQSAHISDTAACDAMTQTAAPTTITDSTGLSGTHDDTVAAFVALTDYTAHAPGAVPVTSNAATDLDTTAAGLATLENECTAAFGVINQNVSDLAQKIIEIIADLGEIKVDTAALKTAVDNLNSTQDSINAAQAAFGVTLAS